MQPKWETPRLFLRDVSEAPACLLKLQQGELCLIFLEDYVIFQNKTYNSLNLYFVSVVQSKSQGDYIARLQASTNSYSPIPIAAWAPHWGQIKAH